jgi:hypothetical protein
MERMGTYPFSTTLPDPPVAQGCGKGVRPHPVEISLPATPMSEPHYHLLFIIGYWLLHWLLGYLLLGSSSNSSMTQ